MLFVVECSIINDASMCWRKSMDKNYTLFEGFIAASLHDIGKLALKNNQWEHHSDLRAVGNRTDIDFVELLGENIVDLISIHHGNVKNKKLFDFSKLSKIEYALILSDKIQSSMLPNENDIKNTVDEMKINYIKSHERIFIPYYGTLEKWDDGTANGLLREVTNQLKGIGCFDNSSSMWANNVFKVQDKLLKYPFITFLPHLSLAMHHQLSATLFLFLCDALEKYDELKDLKNFKFSIIEISPDLLKTFYRMRDVSGLHLLTEELSTKIIGKLYGQYRKKLYGIPNKKSNPFLFYNKNCLVLVHTSPHIVLETLHELLNEFDIFYSLTVKVNEYTSVIDIKSDTKTPYEIIFALAHPVSSRQYSILSDKILSYSSSPDYICMACGKAVDGHGKNIDDKGHILCNFCYNMREKSTGYDLDVFGGSGERLSYIFLKLPDDLVKHSKKVAEDQLIRRFLDEYRIDPYSISPTEQGILEYLQSLREFSLFQNDVNNHNLTGDYEITLFSSPPFTCYLFRETEDQPWGFLRYLNAKISDLKLNPSMILMSCNTKTPFWSLIESIPTYNEFKGDAIYDISKGSVTMFQSDEVSEIRKLAEIARKNNVAPHQLNSLSDVSLNASLDELLLELDVRTDKLKQFSGELAKTLEKLETDESEYQKREKRAVFIKYIGKLVKGRKRRW